MISFKDVLTGRGGLVPGISTPSLITTSVATQCKMPLPSENFFKLESNIRSLYTRHKVQDSAPATDGVAQVEVSKLLE